MALEGLNPAIGLTGEPSRWRVSPIWADDNQFQQTLFAYQCRNTFWRLLHIACDISNLTWIKRLNLGLFRMHDPNFSNFILLPGVTRSNFVTCSSSVLEADNPKHSSLTFLQNAVLYIYQRNHSSILVIPRYLCEEEDRIGIFRLTENQTWKLSKVLYLIQSVKGFFLLWRLTLFLRPNQF